jgi:hypothetical protein
MEHELGIGAEEVFGIRLLAPLVDLEIL